MSADETDLKNTPILLVQKLNIFAFISSIKVVILQVNYTVNIPQKRRYRVSPYTWDPFDC